MTAHVCTTSWYNNFLYKVRLLAIKYIKIFVMTVCGVTVTVLQLQLLVLQNSTMAHFSYQITNLL